MDRFYTDIDTDMLRSFQESVSIIKADLFQILLGVSTMVLHQFIDILYIL